MKRKVPNNLHSTFENNLNYSMPFNQIQIIWNCYRLNQESTICSPISYQIRYQKVDFIYEIPLPIQFYCIISYNFQIKRIKQLSQRMSTSSMSIVPIPESLSTNKQRLQQVQSQLSQVTKDIVDHDTELVESQSSKISEYTSGIRSILDKIQQYKSECSQTIKELSRQISELQKKISEHDQDHNIQKHEEQQLKQIDMNKKEYLNDWKTRIEIAQHINVDKMTKLDLYDRKSKANEIFKWIIVVIYGESETKYYWPNFRQEVFVRDEGVDFRERLGKINASSAKQEQKIKTELFLKHFQEIQACQELSSVKNQVNQIRDIAKIFLGCYKKSQQVKDLEAKIQQSRQKNRSSDQECLRSKARADALSDRIKTNKDYMNILEETQEKLQKKPELYQQKAEMAKEAVSRLKNHDSTELVIDIGSEKRDNCECSIY